MFTRKRLSSRWPKAAGAARCGSTAGSRIHRRRWTVCCASLAATAWHCGFATRQDPCGYGIQRRLSARGHECVVAAPSLIPKRAGDRVKTDRRDAASLAKLHRAGELTAVWVPDCRHEAMRDLVRARLDAVHSLRRARQQFSGFLLRQGCHYRRPAWTRHRRWLAGLKLEQAVHHIVLEDYVAAVEGAEARRDRLTAQIEAMLPDWTLAPVAAACRRCAAWRWSMRRR